MRNEIYIPFQCIRGKFTYNNVYNRANKCTCTKYKMLLTASMFRNVLAVSNM